MIQTIKTYLKTIFITVGPSNCGKTTFVKNTLIPQLKKTYEKHINALKPNVQYISSDEIRKSLLGNSEYSKYDSAMIEVSSNAFTILKTRLQCVTQFPVNADFVIVDTTGLNLEFRKSIADIAYMNNYNVELLVFNYSKHNEYFNPDGDIKTVKKHVQKFRKETLHELKKGINNIKKCHNIKSKNTEIEIEINDIEYFKTCLLDQNKKYLVIGDIHTCLDELKQLLINVGYKINNNTIKRTKNTEDINIVLIGDLVDKGVKNKEIIEFVYHNLFESDDVIVKILIGNHEEALYNLLLDNDRESKYKPNFIKKYYNSYIDFKDDDEIKRKFIKIYNVSLPFVFFRSNDKYSKSFYVTHAPCADKFVGKLNKLSVKKQTYYFMDKEKSLYDNLKHFMLNKNSYNLPLHVIGHVCTQTPYYEYQNNKVFIDTGCINGNMLTGTLLGKHMSKPKFFTIPFMNMQPCLEKEIEDLMNHHIKVNLNTKVQMLNKEQSNRLKTIIDGKINYISGTISPADKDLETNELESLKKGLQYYHKHMENTGQYYKLCLQPKYMGSRINIYLFRDIDKCYSVSRNGYPITKIPHDTMKLLYIKLLERLDEFMNKNKILMLLIDGELMPWKALGDNLIEKFFNTFDIAMNSEINILSKVGFDESYSNLLDRMEATDFKIDQHKLSNRKLNDKYGRSDYQTFKELCSESKRHITTEQMKEFGKIFHEQLQIYGKDSELDCKPFGILKIVFEDGKQILPGIRYHLNFEDGDQVFTQEIIFKLVSDDEICIIDLSNDFDEELHKATEFFDKLIVGNQMEGLIIKPNLIIPNLAPFIKVRNADYLTIIYGPDYKTNYKYDKLMKQKNILNKIKTSIKEFNFGLQMLKTKVDDISFENEKFVNTLVEFLFTEESEKKLDPRL